MQTLADLNPLSHAQKDALIRGLFAQVQMLTRQVETLTAKNAELEGRLAKNSRNSSKPPSSDGLNRPQPQSLRKSTGKSSGGQKGHPGKTLRQVAEPDQIEAHAPACTQCDACGAVLESATVVETRQVFDIPAQLRHEVTEHRLLAARCTCGKVHRGAFPAGVSAHVQYGARLKAAVVHLTHHHMLPIKRVTSLIDELFGLRLSEGSVVAFQAEARQRLEPTVQAIGKAFKTVPVVHSDETGMNVAGTLHWLHVLATRSLTWIGSHANRGKKAFDAFGILGALVGTLVHDGWKPYRDLACTHALCNAHHLRELTYVFEQMQQAWANRLIELLLAACREVGEAESALTPQRMTFYRAQYNAILDEGEAANPRAPPSGRPGRTKQSKVLNLIDRLRTHADDVWRFSANRDVPFSNNLAEQAVRMPKVKQKISGGFRTAVGLQTFCVVRSYLATMHKQKTNLFSALSLVFQGSVPQPRFA